MSPIANRVSKIGLAKVPINVGQTMAYYITRPDLLLVEFQLGMLHAIPVPNIFCMNLYYRLMLCANIWKCFHEYWRKYEHFSFCLKCSIT